MIGNEGPDRARPQQRAPWNPAARPWCSAAVLERRPRRPAKPGTGKQQPQHPGQIEQAVPVEPRDKPSRCCKRGHCAKRYTADHDRHGARLQMPGKVARGEIIERRGHDGLGDAQHDADRHQKTDTGGTAQRRDQGRCRPQHHGPAQRAPPAKTVDQPSRRHLRQHIACEESRKDHPADRRRPAIFGADRDDGGRE